MYREARSHGAMFAALAWSGGMMVIEETHRYQSKNETERGAFISYTTWAAWFEQLKPSH